MKIKHLKVLVSKRALKRRNGIFEAVAMIGVVLLILAVMVAVTFIIVEVGPDMAVELLTDMPTFFEWEDGAPITETVSDGLFSYEVPKSTKLMKVYEVVIWLTVGVGAISGLVALASWILEDFDLVPKGTAVQKFFHMLFFIPIVIAFPFIWDFIAIVVESTSLFLMNPFEPDNPRYYASIIFDKAGALVQEDDMYSLENWGKAFSDPRNFVEGILVNVVMAAFKGFILIQLTVMMLIFSAIREFMTLLLAMLFPFIWMLRTIDFTKSIGDTLFTSFVGLTIAPILSGMVILIAGIEISESTDSPIEEWGASIAALFLAISLPVMLSPLTGFVAIQATQMMQTAFTGAAGAGMAAVTGGASALAGGASAGGKAIGAGGQMIGAGGRVMSNIPELNAGGKTSSFGLGNIGSSGQTMGKMDLAKHVIASSGMAAAQSMMGHGLGSMGVKGSGRDMKNNSNRNIGLGSQNFERIEMRNNITEPNNNLGMYA